MVSDDLLARASHLYYVLGLTQAAVADRLGVTRIKAGRLLAEARERGVVRIRIQSPGAHRLEREARLADRFGLALVSVTPSDTTPDRTLSQVIGHYAAATVQGVLREGVRVAIGWGVTLKAMASACDPMPLGGVEVVPMLGSLSRRSTVDRFEAAALLAGRLGAECYYMPSPIICASGAARDMIMAQPMTAEVMDRAAAADLALMSLGGRQSSTLRAMGFLSEAEFASVQAAGAIGNLNGYFLDAAGEVIDHEVNHRVVGLPPTRAWAIPQRIMISGGPAKVAILTRLLGRGLLTGLITDEATADALLAQP